MNELLRKQRDVTGKSKSVGVSQLDMVGILGPLLMALDGGAGPVM